MDTHGNSAERNISETLLTTMRIINKKKMTGRSVVNFRGAPTLRRNISPEFQSSSNVIPESEFKCKDHNEDVSLSCNTCNVVVCSSCVTESHKRHAFPQLMDSITQLKEKNKKDLRRKVEIVVKAITKEGTKTKVMVDKCIAQMIASFKNQSRMEKYILTKIMADTRMDLKSGIHLDKKIYELDKKLIDEKLLQSVLKLIHDIAKLTIEPIPDFPNIQYTTTFSTDDIKQLFGILEIR
ncbi:unnamed protein product [Mytilus coruscus]|uniref:B box-type domain-containing protein n=1 Tax=Mytilus coruscus TaxID=42192 RepID=A0A6J8BA96_MYTCO|nr:unnamed protein product [Mytilus coruscus]